MPITPNSESNCLSNSAMNHTPKIGTRKHSELSPEDEQTDSKKQRSLAQNDSKLEKFMDEIKSQLSMMNQKMDEFTARLDTKIDSAIADMKKLQNELTEVRAEVMNVEDDNKEINKKILSHEQQLNVLNQLKLENQLSMVNIAATIDEDKFLEDVNNWCGNILNETLMSHNFSSNPKFKTKAAHLHFNTVAGKMKFLNFVKSKQKDANKKYMPILNEYIFTLKQSDVNRANPVDFRSPMTDTNREVFNLARKVKRKNQMIEGVWMSNGSIKIRIGKLKPIQIADVEHLKDVLSTNGINIPQE